MNVYTTMESPVGELLLVGRSTPGGVTLTSVSMAGQRFAPAVRDGWRRDPAAFAEVTRQLAEYFVGERRVFSLDLVPRDRIQALGAAIGANPLAIIRPCHRVIGSDGGMRGYAGGVERKQQLLAHEGALLGVPW